MYRALLLLKEKVAPSNELFGSLFFVCFLCPPFSARHSLAVVRLTDGHNQCHGPRLHPMRVPAWLFTRFGYVEPLDWEDRKEGNLHPPKQSPPPEPTHLYFTIPGWDGEKHMTNGIL